MGEDCNKKSRNLTNDWSGYDGRSFLSFRWIEIGEFVKNEISVKMKPYNPTSLQFIFKTIKEILVDYYISLKFILLSIYIIVVWFCRVCMVCVGFLYGFTPICRVFKLFNNPSKNVKTLQTRAKPYTLYGAFLQNPTNPTGCEYSRKPHQQRVFENHQHPDVGM